MIIAKSSLSEEEIEKIVSLEESIFNINAYNYKEILSYNNNLTFTFFLFMKKNDVLGYCIIQDCLDYIDIYKIGVIKEFRNEKIGSKLINFVKKYYCKKILAEVSDRDDLINFYLKNNFKVTNFRKNYYIDKSNALIVEWKAK